jgi:very-short-patch-repair endonuclease
MPRKVPIDHPDDLVARYYAGTSVKQLARELGCSVRPVRRCLVNQGVEIRSREESVRLAGPQRIFGPRPHTRRAIPGIDELRLRYEAGESLKRLAGESGVDRGVLIRRFRDAGTVIRGRSEAERLKWAAMKRDRARVERQCAAAWHRARGRVDTQECKAARAATHEARVNRVFLHEREIAAALAEAGVPFRQQIAVGPYNVDLAHHESGVAVEVMSSELTRPRAKAYPQRLEHILDAGWCVVLVYLREWRRGVDYAAIRDHLIAYTKLAGRDKALRGQYGVIGRHGESVTRRYDYLPNRPRIVGAYATDRGADHQRAG